MKALMIIAHEQFRDEEYLEPKKVFEENGISVTTASWEPGTATGKLGTQVNIDIDINEADIKTFDVIVFIGGTGCKQYWDDPVAHKITQETVLDNKILAAICSAPVILARAGILKKIHVTCHKGDAEEVKKEGAIYTGKPVEQDGMIITADGPASATSFGIKIVEALKEL